MSTEQTTEYTIKLITAMLDQQEFIYIDIPENMLRNILRSVLSVIPHRYEDIGNNHIILLDEFNEWPNYQHILKDNFFLIDCLYNVLKVRPLTDPEKFELKKLITKLNDGH